MIDIAKRLKARCMCFHVEVPCLYCQAHAEIVKLRTYTKDTPMNYLAKLYMVPSHMHGAITLWIEKGVRPGDFLTALLSNDLMGAMGRADEENQLAIHRWCTYLYSYVPNGCYGSPEKVKAWAADGGLNGIVEKEHARDAG